jgi:hypothetical protein
MFGSVRILSQLVSKYQLHLYINIIQNKLDFKQKKRLS